MNNQPLLTEKTQEQMRTMICEAFELLKTNSTKLAGEMAVFNENHRKMTQRLHKGTQQTNGRIV